MKVAPWIAKLRFTGETGSGELTCASSGRESAVGLLGRAARPQQSGRKGGGDPGGAKGPRDSVRSVVV